MDSRIVVNLRHLALYPTGCYCEVLTEERGFIFCLIALFMNGLRLKATNAEDLALFQREQEARANIKLLTKGLESGAFPCKVRSIQGEELFMSFHTPMSFPFLSTIRDNPEYFPW